MTVAHNADTLLVPRTAIASNVGANTQATVVTIDPVGHVIHTPVQIGLANDSQVEIKSGLSEGQVVSPEIPVD